MHFTGYLPDEFLPGLYSGALAFAYPSVYEGFGLPPLEAMACGTPVLTGNLTSLPEVVEDAGLMVNPHDVQEIARVLLRLITDDALRLDLTQRGLKQAAKFSWEKAAAETWAVLESVARGDRV